MKITLTKKLRADCYNSVSRKLFYIPFPTNSAKVKIEKRNSLRSFIYESGFWIAQ